MCRKPLETMTYLDPILPFLGLKSSLRAAFAVVVDGDVVDDG